MIPIPVEHALSHAARTVSPETSTTEAATMLRDPSVPALVVLEDESVVGMITESDIVAFVAETLEPHPVDTIMSSPVTTVSPTESLVDAAESMRANGVSHLPVVDGGAYCGLVSASRLAPYLSRTRLEIEWQDDPMRIDADDSGGIRISE
ncbi:CBS domain-containing protein [Natronorubrum thiooxidans]|uniref:CBS domain-containing protein n=1 Tax=Natronorubrum thiooxidans TaxID=308853 RepID=A0A1N7C1C5_9EURY|nr:CBS domain-containing protein [Natronorubrum thiooxidans]SIR57377.1 CBS domain-containing protein [Natronorubrum thiooxidans]